MNYKNITVGTVVKSGMGHDKDRMYVVVASVSEDFVLVADGDKRTLENPKMKRLKHLRPLLIAKNNLKAKEIAKVIENKDSKETIKDSDIKKLLKEIKKEVANG